MLDRLMGAAAEADGRMTLDQVKDLIARDLEALLNTRAMPRWFDAHPRARGSVLNYGLADFAGMCLTSSEDREAICASLKLAIETHEPRLTQVCATLEPSGGSINRLHIAINAKLLVGENGETVNFNAVLQPSSLRYSIVRGVRQRSLGKI
ncbi:type VI secretion system baseplate subunit TssE [Massilia terrae]